MGSPRAAASTNPGNEGNRWGLNCPPKTAADDSSLLLSKLLVGGFLSYTYFTSFESGLFYFSFDRYHSLKMSKKQIYYSDKYNDEEFEYRYG